jgi:hypothetical protein
VRITIVGSDNRNGNTIIVDSPFELLVWFGDEKPLEGKVKITNLRLTYYHTKEEILKENNIEAKNIKKDGTNFRAYFSFHDIAMEHEDAELSIKFELTQNDISKPYHALIRFGKKYERFKRYKGV